MTKVWTSYKVQKIWPNYETKEKALASGSRSRHDLETGTSEEASSSASMISLQPISTGSASLQEGDATKDQVCFHLQFVGGTIGGVDPLWRPGTQTAKSTKDSDAAAGIMSLAELQDWFTKARARRV